MTILRASRKISPSLFTSHWDVFLSSLGSGHIFNSPNVIQTACLISWCCKKAIVPMHHKWKETSFLALSYHNSIFSLANENSLNNTDLPKTDLLALTGCLCSNHACSPVPARQHTAFLHLYVSFTQIGVGGSSHQGQARGHRRVNRWTSASLFGELHRERFWEDG